MKNAYSIYLMIQLAQVKAAISKELEYDLSWETVKALYNEFQESKFNKGDKPENECILEFLNARETENPKKWVARVAWNKEAATYLEEHGWDKLEAEHLALGENSPYIIEVMEFESEPELKAYVKGVDDSNGWENPFIQGGYLN